MIPVIGSVASQTRKVVRDVFTNRYGTLDKSITGSKWRKLRGDWSIAENKLTTAPPTDLSSSQITVLNTANSTKKTISIKGTAQGTGAALWVTDSGNWWAIATQKNGATNCNCQQCEQCNAYQCNATGCVCGWWCAGYGCTGNYNASNCTGYNTSNCNGWNTSNCNRWCSAPWRCCGGYNGSNCRGWNGSNCKGWNTSNCNATGCTDLRCGCYGCTSSSCISTSLVDCNCQTCYPPYIRLFQSVGNTVSQITEWAISSAANSIKVLLNGRDITIKAYSDSNLANQIGSDLTYTATGASITANYGIIVTPSAYDQGNTVDEISIENK